jgi:hypothetical protein
MNKLSAAGPSMRAPVRPMEKTSQPPEMWSHTSAAKLFGAMKAGGVADPEDKLRRLVVDGKLIPWRIHFQGDGCLFEQMKADASADLVDVWFDNDALRELGLITADWYSLSVQREKRQRRFIARFEIAEQRRRPRRWCGFQEIADWCAREKGGSLRNEGRREAAYHDLKSALIADKFSESGRSKVLHLPPDIPSSDARAPTRLDAKYLRGLLEWYDDDDFARLVLAHCWVPARICEQWFIAQRVDPPGDWFSTDSHCDGGYVAGGGKEVRVTAGTPDQHHEAADRPVGRPGIGPLCRELYEERREKGVPRECTMTAEARQILRSWPTAAKKPKVKTIAARLAATW